MELSDNGMKDYSLPSPPTDKSELSRVVEASLTFLDLAKPETTYLLLTAIYTAPLADILDIDFGIHSY